MSISLISYTSSYTSHIIRHFGDILVSKRNVCVLLEVRMAKIRSPKAEHQGQEINGSEC